MYGNKLQFLINLLFFTGITSVFSQTSVDGIQLVTGSSAEICEGSMVGLTIELDPPSTAYSYEWSVSIDNVPSDLLDNDSGIEGQGSGIGDDFRSLNIALEDPGEYVFSVEINGSVFTLDNLMDNPINVVAAPILNAGEDAFITRCKDANDMIVLFDLLLGTPDPGGTWVDPSGAITFSDDQGIIDFTDPAVFDVVGFGNAYTYTVTSNTTGVCSNFSVSREVNLRFTDGTEGVQLAEEITICSGDIPILSSNLDTSVYENFQWFNDGILVDTGADTELFEAGTYFVTYDEIGNPNACTLTSSSTIVSEAVIPQILDLESIEGDFSNNNSIRVVLVGDNDVFLDGNYEFNLDGEISQSTNVFENVGPGTHTVTVTDLRCNVISAPFSKTIIGFPKFFSPNGDGRFDNWNIELDPSVPIQVNIFVFDRFGKLIQQVFPTGSGWDGTFAGANLPSDDYWYKAFIVETGETLTGHFTLIR